MNHSFRTEPPVLSVIQSTVLTYGRIHFRDENRLGRKTRLPTENSSDNNPVKDEFSVLNLSVYFFHLNRRENRTGNSSETKNCLKFTLEEKIKTTFLHLRLTKKVELESQQLFMAPKRDKKAKSTAKQTKRNKVWIFYSIQYKTEGIAIYSQPYFKLFVCPLMVSMLPP